MEKEFRIENYGVRPLKTRSIIEIQQNVPEAQAIILVDQNTAVFSKGNSLYKKTIGEEGIGKVFSRSTGTSPKIVSCDSVIALFNREGKIRLIDFDGNSLSFIDTGNSPIRAVSFLTSNIICTGGESSKLQVYSIYDTTRLFECTFTDYIDSITSNGKYLAVSLASGEIRIYSYFFNESGETGIASRKRVKLLLNEMSGINVESPSVLQFINDKSLFIGLSTGLGYIYSIEDGLITSQSAMHSKGFTKVEVHETYIITGSLDGRIRVSTHSLREISSLYAGAPILSFSTLFARTDSKISGVQYLLSTTTGNVLVYRDRWTADRPKEEPILRKTTPHTIQEYSKTDTTEMSTVTMSIFDTERRGKYARLIHTFQYRKALSSAIKTGNHELITSIMDYLHRIDRLIGSISCLTEDEVSVTAGISIDLIRIRKFFDMSFSVLMYCSDILYDKEGNNRSPLIEIVERAVQEAEEELLTQSTLIETVEYIKGIITEQTVSIAVSKVVGQK